MKTYVIDIDGTICSNNLGDYEKCIPIYDRISYINYLYSQGNRIKLFTERVSGNSINCEEKTREQLNEWNVKYHELRMGKPAFDILIDDKTLNSIYHWNNNNVNKILQINNENKIIK